MSTLVFLPAWNEAENLPDVLDELKLVLPEVDVLVVDDGSTDDTADVARGRGADVVSFSENQGLPAGIAAGYAYALKHDYELCGRVDADGQHPPAELERLLERVRDGQCDVAVGSRFASGEGFAPYRYTPSGPRRFGTVQVMVTNGGGGMPSFKGQLSEQQIRDVAAFVSTRAGSG